MAAALPVEPSTDPDPRGWALLGIAGPLGFLGVSFAMAALRPELIRTQGWVSWPSSMALGGLPGIPQIAAFAWLGVVCYPAFAQRALRPTLVLPAAWAGMLIVAAGDVLLAFPTDAPGAEASWHGAFHLIGILVATLGTAVAAAGVTLATLGRATWRPWRWAGAPSVALATTIGLIAGFDAGWAKVVYVIGITLPVALAATLVRSDATPMRPPGWHPDGQV
jgi:hypothetical protein